ncbi:MAG: cell division protein ZapA [Oligoflexia bacterium]|nr:cell division protein ZapA [Oligoflexia bacterium]
MSSGVTILGQRIPLRVVEEDASLSAEVLALVSSRLEAAESRLKTQKNVQNVTLLALLDLAEEYVRAKRRVASFQAELSAQVDQIP